MLILESQIAVAVFAIPILAILMYPVALAAAVAVPVEKIDTGSNSLNHEITDFYKCVSDTHKDPPSISVVNDCYSSNVGGDSNSDSGGGSSSSDNFFTHELTFHHFSDQPNSEIIHPFHHHDFIIHLPFRIGN